MSRLSFDKPAYWLQGDFTYHNGVVSDLRWNCDGSYLATASADKTVKIGALNGNSLRMLQACSSPSIPKQIVWHPSNPNKFAIAGDDKNVELWEVRAQKPYLKIPTFGGNINISWSPDGQKLSVGNYDDKLTILELTDSEEKYHSTTKLFTHEVNQIAWSADSSHILLATGHKNLGDVQVLKYTPAEGSSKSSEMVRAATHPKKKNKKKKAAESESDIVQEEEKENPERERGTITLIISIKAHVSNCVHCMTDPRKQRLAVSGYDQSITLWKLDDMLATKSYSYDGTIKCISYSGDGNVLGICGEGSKADFIDATSAKCIKSITCPAKVSQLAIHPKRSVIAFATDYKQCAAVRIVSFETNVQQQKSSSGRNPNAKTWQPTVKPGSSFQELLANTKFADFAATSKKVPQAKIQQEKRSGVEASSTAAATVVARRKRNRGDADL